MTGIYIHIPFCRSRCIYCAFYSTTSLELRQRYVDAVCREMSVRSQKSEISTIYLGGGTPSQLTIEQLRQIFDSLYIYNKVCEEVEVTIEVNPDDVTDEFAEGLRTLPVNRVSMGVQTFDNERLQFLHRRHTAAQVSEAVKRLRQAGIQNISIDLMYGFPGETLSDWQLDIDSALALNVEHISAYCLTVEEDTVLYKIINGQWTEDSYDNLARPESNHNYPLSTIHYPDEELERQMYEQLIDRLEAAGFEHYEISNFAKPGFRSRHNSSYWDGTPYIGIGAAAHSYDGTTRSWNVADIHQYMEGIEQGQPIAESETLDGDTSYNDKVTVALRTREGLDVTQLSDTHKDYCLKNATRFIDDGLLRLTPDRLSLTRKGLFVSDMIMAELMKVSCRASLLLLLLLMPLLMLAQISGVVLDASDGGPVPYATVQYKGNRVSTIADGQGHFRIDRHNGWRLTISSVGYREQVINVGPQTPAHMTIRLASDNRTLSEVTVKSKKKSRYSRKDNPAVELMRKVIANKRKADLKRHDYYRYQNYQKIGLGLNDLKPETLEKGIFKKYPWLREQVDTSQYTDKLVLPLTVDEMVTEHLYRKDPKAERTIVKGTKSSGVNDLFQTGEILTTVMREVFADVDIYDDYILLMRHKFSSPIGRDAIQFYRFYITDTTYVGQDRCIHLDFLPNNQQDYGFRGQIYILDDTTYQVKRCELYIPRTSDINWMESMQCMQEFARQDNGEWLLTVDDMIVELMVTDWIQKAVVTRTTRKTDFSFDPLPNKRFKSKNPLQIETGADHRSDAFWQEHRQVEFTKSEQGMSNFLTNIEQLKGFKYVIFVLKALFENYLETGSRDKPSKFDVGPINTFISQNFYDGLRFRFGGQTTANLNPHLFAKGYYAYGTKTHEHYYNGELTYSFTPKQYLPQEFPVNNLTFSSKRDVALPSDKYAVTDKDNVFSSFKVHDIDKMFMYNTQRLAYEYETPTHWRFTADLKTEKIEPIGNLTFQPLSSSLSTPHSPLSTIRYTESTFGIRYAPDEKFVNTKQRRRPMNKDAWYIQLQHTVGYNHLLGGQYNYNYTELEWFRRTWLPMSWGKIDTRLQLGQQWNQVPWPLLPMPQANLSYIVSPQLFNMINNMEFLNDRYASLMLTWEMGGKLLNRIPLLRKLKWREIFEVKGLWGALSKKNNPYLSENQGSKILMQFPENCYIMDGKRPYLEYAIGIQNIFSLIQIEYVHRINYLDLPTAQKHGIRFVINPSF